VVGEVVAGISEACRASGCALLGGETAEMPGVYTTGEFDVAGTIVGVMDRARILPADNLRAGDVLIGLRSNGPHTNGYSLIRKIFHGTPLDTRFEGLEATLGEALLAPHRSYFPLLGPILETRPGLIKALAHLTGGGWIENIPRILPAGLSARIQAGSWPVPVIFNLIAEKGKIQPDEMLRVFNMGVGMVAVVGAADVAEFQQLLGETCWVVGELITGEKKVVLS
jgi:phosphoribosylformylglycinamidine cyclo-ligase